MQMRVNEFPKRPLPNAPQPEPPQRSHVQPPMVFVYEKQGWEYKVLTKNVEGDPSLTEDELHALGASHWELVGMVPLPGTVQFYFKRVRI